MNEERAEVSGISDSTDFFNACEIGDLEYVKHVVNKTKRGWSEWEILVITYSFMMVKNYTSSWLAIFVVIE